MKPTSVFSELKRRNVFKVATVYTIAAWLIIQVSATVFPRLQIPEWTITFIIVLMGIGFPITLIITWAFELTPEGLKKTKQIDSENSTTAETGNKLNKLTLAALAFAIVFIVTDKLYLSPSVSAESEPRQSEKMTSIAVLPFKDFSADHSQDYFGKGIAEELIHALSSFTELKVVGRTSAFSYSDEGVDLRKVGSDLNVAYVLEGSVRKNEHRIRVTAQLIRTEDGYHEWSETYDRELADIFSIQDEIVARLSRSLEFRLGVGSGHGRADDINVNPRAYEEYLKGLYYWGEREIQASRIKAYRAFKIATEIDPNFADAWAHYAESISKSTAEQLKMSQAEFLDEANSSFNKALELNPSNTRALSGFAAFLTLYYFDVNRSLELLQQAAAISPNAAYVHYDKYIVLHAARDFGGAEDHLTRAISLDPRNCTYQARKLLTYVLEDRLQDIQQKLGVNDYCQNQFDKGPYYIFSWIKFLANLYLSNKTATFEAYQELSSKWENTIQASSDPKLTKALMDFKEYYGTAIDLVYQDSKTMARITEEVLRQGNEHDLIVFFEAEGPIIIYNLLGLNDQLLHELQRSYDHVSLGAIEAQTIPLFAKGNIQINEKMRRDPRYREFWNQPGLRELEIIRRQNGYSAGLPLD